MDNPRAVGGKMTKILLPSWMKTEGASWYEVCVARIKKIFLSLYLQEMNDDI